MQHLVGTDELPPAIEASDNLVRVRVRVKVRVRVRVRVRARAGAESARRTW